MLNNILVQIPEWPMLYHWPRFPDNSYFPGAGHDLNVSRKTNLEVY